MRTTGLSMVAVISACMSANPPSSAATVAGPAPVSLAIAGGGTCAVLADGQVACWGERGDVMKRASSAVPVRVPGIDDATAIVGSGHVRFCVSRRNHPVTCWGDEGEGTPTERTFAGATGALRGVGIGNDAVCVLDAAGFHCAGSNGFDKLFSVVPGDARSFVLGGGLLYTLDEQGRLGCAGFNAQDACLHGKPDYRAAWARASLAEPVRTVATSGTTTCAVLASGATMCWGERFRTYGSDNKHIPTAPVPVPDLDGATALAVGRREVCGIVGGRVACVDINVGKGAISRVASGATAIAAGTNHACAIVGARVSCWGDTRGGELGEGSSDWRGPVTLDVTDAREVAVGITSTIVTHADGRVTARGAVPGHNPDDFANKEILRLGAGERPVILEALRQVVPHRAGRPLTIEWEAAEPGLDWLAEAIDLRLLAELDCGLFPDRTVRCEGTGGYGEDDRPHRANHEDVLMKDVEALDGGPRGTVACGLTKGRVDCFGVLASGGGRVAGRSTPAPLAAGVRQISVGDSAVCGLLDTGDVRCAGLHPHDGSRPMGADGAVCGLPKAVEVRVGTRVVCARSDAGEVWCAGDNGRGALGQTDATPRACAVRVPGIDDARSLALTHEHACVVRDDGAVTCWGENMNGQIGPRAPMDAGPSWAHL